MEKEKRENDKKFVKISRLQIIYIIVIIILIIILITGYFLLFMVKPCFDKECYFGSLKNCKRTSFVKEDSLSTWSYFIKGKSGSESCKVEVGLLKIKEGNVEIEKLQDKKMTCIVDRQDEIFPEKDLSKCSGILKEEIQEILIQRMHNYLVTNVKDLETGFKSLV